MKKNKKQDNWQPGSQGMFYSQKCCPVCQKLIVGRSPKSYQGTNSDLGNKLKAHREECQSKQLKLSLPGRQGEQAESIKRVTLRGEKKSV
jgi:hypothetical protein